MEHIDEYEMLIEYSEMTTFDFNSKEFQKIRKDYLECKSFISEFSWWISEFINKIKFARSY